MAARRRFSILVLTAGGLIAAACGDPVADMNEAVAGAVTDGVPQATAAEAACVADLTATDAALPELTAAGLTPETIRNDASLLLPSKAPAVVDDALTSCLDLDARLIAFVADAGVPAPDSCNPDWTSTPDVLTEALIEAQPIDADRSDPTRAALLDVVRDCVDDNEFARLAGIDAPAALAAVLLVNPFTDASADACLGRAAVDALGAERLADLGITVDDPDLLAVLRELADGEFEAITAAAESCDLPSLLTQTVSDVEMQVGPCAVSALDDDELAKVIEDHFFARTSLPDPAFQRAVDACTDDLLTEFFGPERPVSEEVSFFAYFLAREIATIAKTNEFEEVCVQRGIESLIDVEILTAVDAAEARLAAGQPLTVDDELTFVEFQALSAEVGALCIEPWKRIVQDLQDAGINGEVQACTIETAGEEPARMIVDGLPGLIRGDIEASFDVFDGMDLVRAAIETCGSAADVSNWDRYLDSLFAGEVSFEPSVEA